jgi:hypothetical protein
MKAMARQAALAAFTLVALAPTLFAQISPGPLSRPHAKLEGSSQCLACHDPSQGVAATKCLACHEPLRKRIAAGKGLHARPDHSDCKRCHVDHQGAEFELVFWGKQGRAAFDHALTGHALAGKHARLACEQCHKTRSFLGAVTECASCHKDEHRGQFAPRTCTVCHGEQAWKPAPGFDHAKTPYPLTGRHATVACERCHNARQPDPKRPAESYRVFRVAAGRECASCHADVHKARLGTNCASCHNTFGWRQAKTVGFDHGRTGYPLAGRHAAVACEKCHTPGQPLRVKHERCSDCHRDSHGGELVRRADGGRCESCHDVQTFRPARYGTEDHAKTAYPLRGAHLAIACDECHRPSAAAGARQAAATRQAAVVPLKLTAARCSDCHRDPHRGETAATAGGSTCEACHRVESWRDVGFDHARTRYPLSGRHAQVTCARCHARAEGVEPARLAFKGAATECAACHRDPHDGQFAQGARRTACERCHATDSLKATRFAHDRDTRYKLDGAHVRLACATCHKPEVRAGRPFVRYKPLPLTCTGCHGTRQTAAIGGPQ